jgi:hypothetical protein
MAAFPLSSQLSTVNDQLFPCVSATIELKADSQMLKAVSWLGD